MTTANTNTETARMTPERTRQLSSDHSLFSRLYHRLHGLPAGGLVTVPITNYDDYERFHVTMVPEYQRRERYEQSLVQGDDSFTSEGYCYVCGTRSSFITDFGYASGEIVYGKRVPNWRERLTCARCGLCNRLRASVHFLERNLGCRRDSHIYITEQTTPLYQHLHRRYPNVIGSEYFGDRLPYGSNDPVTGIRNESITKLTFADNSFDHLLSFDVFEHLPDCTDALRECLRTLKPGGRLLFTVPFNKGCRQTLLRARIRADGSIEHLVEPEYHGDPVNAANGCLCFHTFGWDLIDQLRSIGFADAAVQLFWSARHAYLGTELMLMTARKPT